MLTDVQAKKAKGADKPYKLSDSGGLFLLVSIPLRFMVAGTDGWLRFAGWLTQ